MQKFGHIDVHGASRRGAAHSKNHDHFAIATLSKSMRLHQSNLSIDDDSRVHGHNQGHLFLVADGISGGPAAARASGTAVDSVVQYFLNEMPWYHLADGEPEDVTLALEDALSNAQDEILRTASPGKGGLGTMMTLAFVFWPNLYLAHAGSSRCYLQRRGDVRQLTTDHTLAPVREHNPEVRHEILEVGDVLVLLTDGAAKGESDEGLSAILRKKESAEAVCTRLIDRQRTDDQTVIAARFLPHERWLAEAATIGPVEPLVAKQPTPKPMKRRKRKPCETYRRALVPAMSAAR